MSLWEHMPETSVKLQGGHLSRKDPVVMALLQQPEPTAPSC